MQLRIYLGLCRCMCTGAGTGALVQVPASGDEGFVRIVHSAVFGRTDEPEPSQRLSPLVPLSSEFHAEMVQIIG